MIYISALECEDAHAERYVETIPVRDSTWSSVAVDVPVLSPTLFYRARSRILW